MALVCYPATLHPVLKGLSRGSLLEAAPTNSIVESHRVYAYPRTLVIHFADVGEVIPNFPGSIRVRRRGQERLLLRREALPAERLQSTLDSRRGVLDVSH